MILTECPRDAIQGMHKIVPTELKINYLQKLLEVGFQVLDFGSFVSPKAVPQMADTALVLEQLDLSQTQSELLAIVANLRGAQDACKHGQISILGFPFSISETFQKSNTNKTIDESADVLKQIWEEVLKSGKKLRIYLSMGFGNPYGDPYDPDLVLEWLLKMQAWGLRSFSIADTLGMAAEEDIRYIFRNAQQDFPDLEIGAHFHSLPDQQELKISAAYESGCRSFDSALLGLGGCPLSGNDLVGNIDTRNLIAYLEDQGEDLHLDMSHWDAILRQAQEIKSYAV